MQKLSLYLIGLFFILFSGEVSAQAALVQRAIDQIGSYAHLSYRFVYRQKEYTNDTLIITHRDVLIKAPEDTTFGYFFRMEALNDGNQFADITLYNGQNVTDLHPEDSSYVMQKIRPYPFEGSLPGYLKVISRLLKKKPSQMAADTIIDARACAHVILNTNDTIIDKEHYYTRIHIFIDKLSGLPNTIIVKSRYVGNGDGITNYYSSYRYSDYKLTEDAADMASIAIPKGFHPPKAQPALPGLLASGTVAPDWELYSAEGKKLSLSQLKGKVVLLDFFFIGCDGCMRSLKPLNKLHEKYNNKNVVFVSMTYRDNKQSVTEFSKNYHIKYPVYINAAEVVKSYHVRAFPTFYFIDPKGKIAQVMVGYGDDFEEKVTSAIDNLITL